MKIYQPEGRAREYSPLALNYFKGCDHGCKYCYVPKLFKRFNASYVHDYVSCNINYRELEKSIQSLSEDDKEKQILLSFTGDPYCNAEKGETREVLKILLRHQLHVAILTKNPEKAQRDIDLFREFKRFKIGTTLVFSEEEDRKEWEPGTIDSNRRIESLKYFFDNNIKTWVSFEPVIIPEQTIRLLINVKDYVDHVKVGKLNNFPEIEKNINWSKFLYDIVYILRKENMKFYIKNDLIKYNKGLYFSGNELDKDFLNV